MSSLNTFVWQLRHSSIHCFYWCVIARCIHWLPRHHSVHSLTATSSLSAFIDCYVIAQCIHWLLRHRLIHSSHCYVIAQYISLTATSSFNTFISLLRHRSIHSFYWCVIAQNIPLTATSSPDTFLSLLRHRPIHSSHWNVMFSTLHSSVWL